MRRSRSTRLITSIWAIWFTAILAQPAPLMACLMRAAMATPTSAGAVAEDPAPAMPGMPGMPGDAAAHHGHGTPVDPACAHLGACCCAPVLTAPSDAAPEITSATFRLVRASIPSNVALAPPPATPHTRPFAIGPPIALA